ncbi:peptidylprolyl isomerase [Chloroflexota bacterium]
MVNRCAILLVIVLSGILLATGCTGKEGLAMAKDGNTVKVHYTGKLDDGTIFDTSVGREPLEFTIGANQMIPGFEGAVRGMQVGQVKTVTIPAEEAYGPHDEDMVLLVGLDKLPENLNPAVGHRLQIQQEDGNTAVVVVTDISDTMITLDANHPLAGKALTFEIELVEMK